MSPARPSSRRNSSGGFKPYTRGVTPIMVPSIPDVRQDSKPSQVERPGFPTYSQYKQVETTYLQSLTPRRQGKALISQSLFDRIWDVLHQPESQGETAQFRFWARKMFTVSKTHRVTLGGVDNVDDAPQEVLLHDNLLVAIQEQLYDLLCYCHGSTGHGGRDKTCALIRKHYTWVPKDLVSNFIKTCPTCIMKKCGNMDNAHIVSQIAETKAEDTSLPAMREFFQNIYGAEGTAPPASSSSAAGVSWPPIGGPGDHPLPDSMLEDDPLEAAYREAIIRARRMKPTLPGLGNPSSRGLHSHPMSREVSLFQGLPNGWQYRHPDYASAHAEFMRTKDLPVVDEPGLGIDPQRPRIPSILPLWGPDQFPHCGYSGLAGDSEQFSRARPTLQTDTEQQVDNQSDVSMQYLLMTSERKEKSQEYVQQIDPLLMDYSGSNNYHREDAEAKSRDATDNIASAANYPSSSSINRPAAAPLHINLEFPAEKTFQALLAYRDSLGDGSLTPDSPVMNWHPGNPSPASSESSSSNSQLSAFPTSNITTPASSALPTPIEESGSQAQAARDIKGKKRMISADGPGQEEDQRLSESIQVACGL